MIGVSRGVKNYMWENDQIVTKQFSSFPRGKDILDTKTEQDTKKIFCGFAIMFVQFL
jgi:hypothetical protein